MSMRLVLSCCYQATRARAAAGRSRAARQPPNDPATSPPATASSTARTMAPIVTDADIGTAMVVWVAAGLTIDAPPGPPATCVVGPVPQYYGKLKDIYGMILSTITSQTSPRPTPARPPTMPV